MSPCGRPMRIQSPSTRISEPMAQAASSMTGRPWARATARIAGMSQGMPIWWTTSSARVRAVIAAAIASGSML